ncbi:hypothetical protein NCC49_004823 [Naganishia albida]|nr:hypothetical protein NCC49_004823 [Naganishia albida]
MTVLLTPRTPPSNQLREAKKGTESPELEEATPPPKIIITCPSDDHLACFPHMFTDSPNARHFPDASPKKASHTRTTRDESPVDRRVARVIQYDREPSEPMDRESIRLRAAMREDVGLVGLGLGFGLGLGSMGAFTGSFDSGWAEDKELAAWGGYREVVKELDEVFAKVGMGKLGLSTEIASVDDLDSGASSPAIANRPCAAVPAEMVPLKTEPSPVVSKTLKKKRSSTLLKAKASVDRLSRVFAEGFNKTLSALSSHGTQQRDDFEAESERYRRQGHGSPLMRWNGQGLPMLPPQPKYNPSRTLPPKLKNKVSQESATGWPSSLFRVLRPRNGDAQPAKTAPASPSKSLRGRLPSFRLSFPRTLSGDDSSNIGKKGTLSPPTRNRCDSEESWGDIPVHSKQNGPDDSTIIVDLGRREASEHGLGSVRSLHLLHQSAAWGAMRSDPSSKRTLDTRSSSPSGSSLSVSPSNSSLTMYASQIQSPEATEDEERYRQIARMETLAVLEGKVERRASLAWFQALDRRVEGCR